MVVNVESALHSTLLPFQAKNQIKTKTDEGCGVMLKIEIKMPDK
jgi:hypothetical protein